VKCLRRNRTKFFYALYEGRFPVLGSNGRPNGEYELRYGDPVECYGNISAARGEATTRQFGEDLNYTKVIALAGKMPFDETAVLWVDNLIDGKIPVDNEGNNVAYDALVVRIAESLNFSTIAIQKVNVSN
jgi:hypothetical protein